MMIMVTIWGTLFQAKHGLLAAQQMFFQSFYILFFGFLPFPGMAAIFLLLFINLLAALFIRLAFTGKNFGNYLLHLGLLVLLTGSFYSFYNAEESFLSIREGQSSNISLSDHEWELSIWETKDSVRQVYAISLNQLANQKTLHYPELDMSLSLIHYYRHCQAFSDHPDTTITPAAKNDSGILRLQPQNSSLNPKNNIPGLVFSLSPLSKTEKSTVLLFAKENQATQVTIGNRTLSLIIRYKRYSLPFDIKLIEFQKRNYPGSEIVKSYESKVLLTLNNLSREALISMNKPLRIADYSVFQSSYFTDETNHTYSIFSVSKNKGRFFPYVSGIIMFIGLLIHFVLAWFEKPKSQVVYE
jgi:hypothetical protein